MGNSIIPGRDQYQLLSLGMFMKTNNPPEDWDTQLKDSFRSNVFELIKNIGDQDVCTILCAFLDDMKLEHKWGATGYWFAGTLLEELSEKGLIEQQTGGTDFFDLLDRSLDASDTKRNQLSLMGACLSLGFQGDMDDQDKLEEYRKKIWDKLKES